MEAWSASSSSRKPAFVGKFARTQIRPLYSKLYRRHYAARLITREASALKWRDAVLPKLKPRIARGLISLPDFILFTDATTSAPLIAGVLFKPRDTRAPRLTTGRVPSARLNRFRRRNKIFGSELLPPLEFARTDQKRLANSTFTFYLDSNNAIAFLLRGDSCDSYIAATAATFWKLAHRLGMAVRIGRFRPKLNVADLPTRSLPPPPLMSNKAQNSSSFKL